MSSFVNNSSLLADAFKRQANFQDPRMAARRNMGQNLIDVWKGHQDEQKKEAYNQELSAAMGKGDITGAMAASSKYGDVGNAVKMLEAQSNAAYRNAMIQDKMDQRKLKADEERLKKEEEARGRAQMEKATQAAVDSLFSDNSGWFGFDYLGSKDRGKMDQAAATISQQLIARAKNAGFAGALSDKDVETIIGKLQSGNLDMRQGAVQQLIDAGLINAQVPAAGGGMAF
jgi:hypothetical protein